MILEFYRRFSFAEIVDRHDGCPDKYILEGPVIPHSTYFTLLVGSCLNFIVHLRKLS